MMKEPQPQALGSILPGAVVALADRLRVRRKLGKRARVRHSQITMTQAANVREAWLFSIREGRPLNVFVAVHWGHAPAREDGPQHPVERNAKLRDALKAWHYRHAPGVPFAWIEVREKTRALGEHVHLVTHVPDPLREQFANALARLVAAQSLSVSPTAVDVRPVGPRWWDRFAYLMKGGTDEVREAWLTAEQRARWSRSQGTIEGARVRIAHSIGPTTRQAAEIAVRAGSAISGAA